MPCLAKYSDGFWYRAKLISIQECNPLLIMVEFVDYGSSETVPTSRLRQLPPEFMQYPAQAFKVLLAGFKPALCESHTKIPSCSEWSMEALWIMMDCFQEGNLYASSLASPFQASLSTLKTLLWTYKSFAPEMVTVTLPKKPKVPFKTFLHPWKTAIDNIKLRVHGTPSASQLTLKSMEYSQSQKRVCCWG
ncbi:RING finger protein 17-like [Zootoca vivipara]|uniref:RING finger protein 17-like n=1 Tax=Zootoca vivipara TaxID=8524 RepID=UPI00293BECEE|nr:RING finger protein 17-like [Zootoca vivipara]